MTAPAAPDAVSRGFVAPGRPGHPAPPVHAVSGRGAWDQAWCGARPQFRHRPVILQRPWGEVITCPKCLRALKRGHPYARGSR